MEPKLCSNPKCLEYMWEFETEEKLCKKCKKPLDNAFEFYQKFNEG